VATYRWGTGSYHFLQLHGIFALEKGATFLRLKNKFTIDSVFVGVVTNKDY
jgi:hypothetical protein